MVFWYYFDANVYKLNDIRHVYWRGGIKKSLRSYNKQDK